jgi:hypothetical protein
MQKSFRCILFAAFAAALAAPADAGELKLSMADGRVTLIADDVPLRQILAEWARVGQTRIVNADKLVGPPVTLQLVDQPEGVVLEILLRSAAGYMAAPRPAGTPGTSVYDRIMILATSRAPAVTNTPPPPFANRQPMFPQPMPQPVVETQGEEENVVDPGMIAPPGMLPPGAMVPGMGQPGMGQPGMGQPGMAVPSVGQPGMPQYPVQAAPGQQPVLTAPRPGPLPQPQQPGVPGMGNPYVPPFGRYPQQPRPGGVPPGGDPDRN